MAATEGWPLGVVLAVAGAPRGSTRALARAARRLLRGGGPRRPGPRATRGRSSPRRPRRTSTSPQAAGLGSPDRRRGRTRGARRTPGRAAFHPLLPRVPAPPVRGGGAGPRSAGRWRRAWRRRLRGGGTRARCRRATDRQRGLERGRRRRAREGGALVRRAPETVEAWLAALPGRAARARGRSSCCWRASSPTARAGSGRPSEHCRAAVAGFDAPGRRRSCASRRASRWRTPTSRWATWPRAAAGEALDDADADGDLTARARRCPGRHRARPARGASRRAGTLCDRAFARNPSPALIRRQSPALRGLLRGAARGAPRRRARPRRPGASRRSSGATPSGRCPTCCCSSSRSTRSAGRTTRRSRSRARAASWRAGPASRGGSGRHVDPDRAASRARLGDMPAPRRSWPMSGPDGAAGGPGSSRPRARPSRPRAARHARRVPPRSAPRASSGTRGRGSIGCGAPRCWRPVLVRRRAAGRARALVEETLAARPAGSPARRLTAVLAWLRYEEGDEGGLGDGAGRRMEEAATRRATCVRREWPRVERPLWAALEHGAVDPVAAVGAVADALPGGSALGPFTRHPVAAVRRAALLLSAVAAGHPEGDRAAVGVRATIPTRAWRPPPGRRRSGCAATRRRWRSVSSVRSSCAAGLGWSTRTEWKRRVAARLVRLLLCRAG